MKIDAYKKRWLKHFAASVSQSDAEEYVLGEENLLWHVFSCELLPKDAYLEGDAARQAYDQACKDGAVCIRPFGKAETRPLPRELMCASALDALVEVYVSAADFSWTYIITHEDDLCGPYFCKKE